MIKKIDLVFLLFSLGVVYFFVSVTPSLMIRTKVLPQPVIPMHQSESAVVSNDVISSLPTAQYVNLYVPESKGGEFKDKPAVHCEITSPSNDHILKDCTGPEAGFFEIVDQNHRYTIVQGSSYIDYDHYYLIDLVKAVVIFDAPGTVSLLKGDIALAISDDKSTAFVVSASPIGVIAEWQPTGQTKLSTDGEPTSLTVLTWLKEPVDYPYWEGPLLLSSYTTDCSAGPDSFGCDTVVKADVYVLDLSYSDYQMDKSGNITGPRTATGAKFRKLSR